MELMNLRRSMMDVGSLYHVLEISKIEVPSDTDTIIVPYKGAGKYFIVPSPIITPSEAMASGYAYTFAAGGFTFAETSNRLLGDTTSTFNSSGVLGYWSGVASFDSTRANVVLKGATSDVYFLGGHTYYAIKPKN